MPSGEFDISRIEAQSRAEIISDIGENVRTLIRALEISREPDATTARLMFDMSDKNFAIPPSITSMFDAESAIEEVTVEIDMSHIESVASLKCMFSASTPDGKPVTIFLRETEGEWIADMLVDQDDDGLVLPVSPTKAEVVAFLASIFAPNKRGDYRLFEALDLHDVPTMRNLEEALEKHADWFFSDNAFIIDSGEIDRPYSIDYVVRDGSVETAKVIRPHNGTSTALALDFNQILFGDEYDTADLEGARMYTLAKNGESSPKDCTTENLITFDDFVKELSIDFTNRQGREVSSSRLDTINPDPGSDYLGQNGKPLRSGDDFND